MRYQRRNGNHIARKPPIEIDGYKLANKSELKRYLFLKARQEAGEISDLKCQVKFELMPTAREPSTIGKRGGVKPGKVIMLGCSYIADFTYTEAGKLVCEDVKGFAEADYLVKKKWLYYRYGIVVKEIKA